MFARTINMNEISECWLMKYACHSTTEISTRVYCGNICLYETRAVLIMPIDVLNALYHHCVDC